VRLWKSYAQVMHVVDFREFYASKQGQTAALLLKRQLAGLTGPKSGETMMGLGFATPYMNNVSDDVVSLSFMMARQGVIHWPHGQLNRSALVDEVDLPLLESMVDVALLVHGLEHAETPLEMLQEVWRVLAPQGRVILVVPNRRGLWAASESTPFGHGQPFSSGQISALLKDAKFTITQWRSALYLPPFRNETLLKTAKSFDVAGERVLQRFAGVTIVEAMKQVYAFSSGKRARRLVPRFRPVLLPSPQPARKDTLTRNGNEGVHIGP
jgi:SAM-dependent methyltransferase